MKKKYIILTTLLFAISMVGCKKTYLSQEVNPNAPSVASPANLLSGAEATTAARLNGSTYNYLTVWMGYTTPSGNYVPSPTLEQYSFTDANFQVFNAIYSNLANYNAVITKAAADPSVNNYAAIAQIMSVMCYQELVDNYNDVPYTQALDSKNYLFPAYDPGQSIYNALETRLDAAIATINASGSAANPGGADIIFGGNMASWKKFANTLKLRIALRQSNIVANAAALKTEVAKTATEGYLDDVTFATANAGYSSSDLNGGQQSPFYLYYGYSASGGEQGGHAYYRLNNFFKTMLSGFADARLSQDFAPVGGTMVGLTLGGSNGALTNSFTSAYGPGLDIGPTMNATILGGSEACFLLAEGIVSGYVTGPLNKTDPNPNVPDKSAQDYYQRGITASFVATGVPNAVVIDNDPAKYSKGTAYVYFNQTGLATPIKWSDASANYQKTIITQKYIALAGYGPFEAYNEYRRTGYPDMTAARSIKSGALGSGNAPTRIFFPSTERQTNLAAVSAEPAVNVFSSKIFWAK